MYGKTVRTYVRKNNSNLNYSSNRVQPSALHFNPVGIKKVREKKNVDDSLEDPFDTTFDRLLKDTRGRTLPPPNPGTSYFLSSFESSDHDTTPKKSIPDSEEDLVFESNVEVPEKKPRLKNTNTRLEKPQKVKKAPRIMKENVAKKTDNKETKKFNNPSRKKSEEKIMKLPAKRKNTRLSNDSDDSSTDFVISTKRSIAHNNVEEDPSVHSDSDNSFISPPKNSENNSKKKRKRRIISTSEESSRSEEEFFPKMKSRFDLKACSVVLKRCDGMLKKKKTMLQLKSCSIQLTRMNIPSLIGKITDKETRRKSEDTSKQDQGNGFVENDFVLEENSSKESTIHKSVNGMVIKNCVVSLPRLKPSKPFLARLVSSTPVVKRNNENLFSGLFSPTNLEISNIATPPTPSEIPSTPKYNVTPQIPGVSCDGLENISNSKNPNPKMDSPTKPNDFNSDFLNCSSDYSEIDWTTVSYRESQFEKEVSLQDKRKATSLGKQISESKSISVETSEKELATIAGLSATEGLEITKDLSTNKSLEAPTKQLHLVTERILDCNSDYEKSASLFDDTEIFDNNSTLLHKKLTPIKLDEKKLIESISSTDSSILNQSDFKGFKVTGKSMPDMKKLSPMTSIPTSIVHYFSCEDMDNNSSLIGDYESKNEKTELVRTLAFEKSLSHTSSKSPRKCLNFEEEPKIGIQSESSDSISLNEESLIKKYTNTESFSTESLMKSSIQNSHDKDSLSQNSLDENTQTEKSSLKDDLTQTSIAEEDMTQNSQQNSTLSSPLKTENSQSSEKSASIVLLESREYDSVGIENKSQDFSDNYSDSTFKIGSQNTESEDDSQETVKYADRKTHEIQSPKILEDKVKEQIPKTEVSDTSAIDISESVLPLNRLEDPIRITHRRKNYRNWELPLAPISENDSRQIDETKVGSYPLLVHDEVDPVQEDSTPICDTVFQASNASLDNGKDVELPEQHLFLKPGKSWTRSLSILNNIHSRDDVDKLSVGKGKKWRNSVISILDMQSKGIVQSCVRLHENLILPQRSGVLNENNDFDSKSERLSTFGSTSPNRFHKRISIRVVPDAKKLDIEDSPFLEAYGITSSQSSKTLSQRISSLHDASNSIGPQENFVFNLQLEDSVIKTSDPLPLTTARDVVLERCHQEDYLPFAQCYPEKFLEHCRKIGEGVYGEVFLSENDSGYSVIKIIPIEGNVLVNGEPQKKFHEILSEIVIAKELHDLRFNETYNTSGFVEVKSIKCIIGRYPPKLIALWKSYDDEKKSENDCPSMFDDNQLYISLELGHGGQDLEAFVFQNASESHAVFIQAAFALAVAEKSLEFEHRDFHWGNFLISKTKKSQVSYKLGNREIKIDSSSVQVAIIDFTLSRMSYQGCCIFNDLALDPALFTAEGEYQFEIYRLMKDKLDNDWQRFEPFTNILWLHYTLDKMITLVRYKKKSTKVHKASIERLKELKDKILSYESAYDLVTKCDNFTCLYDDLESSALDSPKKS